MSIAPTHLRVRVRDRVKELADGPCDLRHEGAAVTLAVHRSAMGADALTLTFT